MLPGDDDQPTPNKEIPITFNKHLFSRDNTVGYFLHFDRKISSQIQLWGSRGTLYFLREAWLGIYFLVNRDFKIFEFVIREIHANEELNEPWFVNQFVLRDELTAILSF